MRPIFTGAEQASRKANCIIQRLAKRRPRLLLITSLACAAAAVLAFVYCRQGKGIDLAEAIAATVIGLAGMSSATAFARCHANAALSGRLELLSRAFDAAPEAWMIVTAEGRVEYANRVFDRLFPGPPGAALDRLASGLCQDGGSRSQLGRLHCRAAAGAQVSATFHRWQTPSDSAGCYRIRAAPIHGFRGYSSWNIQDVTAVGIGFRTGRGEVLPAWSKQNVIRSEALPPTGLTVSSVMVGDQGNSASRSLERYRRCFANAPVGIALLDRFGRFEEANRTLGELLRASPQDLKGKELIGLLSEEDRNRIATKLAATANGQPDPEPVEIRPKPPGDKTLMVMLSRKNDALAGVHPAVANSFNDRADELTLHFIDITEQKNLEIQFAQSQKMQAVGQLAGGIAHDFNNLLTAMIGFCDLLLLRAAPSDPSFADIMQIKQNANRAANLVRQLLAFSRQQTLQPRILNITDMLYELRHLIERLIGENIQLKVVHGRDLGFAKVDQSQFEQVIINLAVNARDAMPRGGTLTIRTANFGADQMLRRAHELMPAGEYVLIEIADTGVGIPKDHLARIFDPFFSTKEPGYGTGLGLSTVYGIVKQTGGFVFVDSILGQGTSFQIYLPRCEPPDGNSPVRPDPGDGIILKDLTGLGTVMLVEDDDPVRLFGARALRNKGYKVIEAKGGQAALDLILDSPEKIDLLITDVVMPQMDGPELVRKVREIQPGMKVIFISGYTEDAFRQRLDSGGGIDFLPKPFSLKQLATKVREVLTAGTA
jgi:PAS domain S-box-containing protein